MSNPDPTPLRMKRQLSLCANNSYLKMNINPLKKWPRQLKPWRKLVEAMGIEPMSAIQQH